MAAATITGVVTSNFIRCSNCGKCCPKEDTTRLDQFPCTAGPPVVAVRPSETDFQF